MSELIEVAKKGLLDLYNQVETGNKQGNFEDKMKVLNMMVNTAKQENAEAKNKIDLVKMVADSENPQMTNQVMLQLGVIEKTAITEGNPIKR